VVAGLAAVVEVGAGVVAGLAAVVEVVAGVVAGLAAVVEVGAGVVAGLAVVVEAGAGVVAGLAAVVAVGAGVVAGLVAAGAGVATGAGVGLNNIRRKMILYRTKLICLRLYWIFNSFFVVPSADGTTKKLLNLQYNLTIVSFDSIIGCYCRNCNGISNTISSSII
jgi:hypothetical protein